MSSSACPRCGTPRGSAGRFCSSCAYDFWGAAAGAPQSAQGEPSRPPPPSGPTPSAPGGRASPSALTTFLLIAIGVGLVAAVGVYFLRPGAPNGAGVAASASARPSNARPTSRSTPRPTAAPTLRPEHVLSQTSEVARLAVTATAGYAWTDSPLNDGADRWLTDTDNLTTDYPCSFELIGDPVVKRRPSSSAGTVATRMNRRMHRCTRRHFRCGLVRLGRRDH